MQPVAELSSNGSRKLYHWLRGKFGCGGAHCNTQYTGSDGDATIPGRGNGVTCAVSKLGLQLVAGKRMVHVGIEPLLHEVGGNLGVVVLWSIVAGLFLSLGFVLR